MKVKDVAKMLGTTEMTIRVGLQQGVFPFGTAFKTKPNNKQYTYIIYPAKVEEYVNRGENSWSK